MALTAPGPGSRPCWRCPCSAVSRCVPAAGRCGRPAACGGRRRRGPGRGVCSRASPRRPSSEGCWPRPIPCSAGSSPRSCPRTPGRRGPGTRRPARRGRCPRDRRGARRAAGVGRPRGARAGPAAPGRVGGAARPRRRGARAVGGGEGGGAVRPAGPAADTRRGRLRLTGAPGLRSAGRGDAGGDRAARVGVPARRRRAGGPPRARGHRRCAGGARSRRRGLGAATLWQYDQAYGWTVLRGRSARSRSGSGWSWSAARSSGSSAGPACCPRPCPPPRGGPARRRGRRPRAAGGALERQRFARTGRIDVAYLRELSDDAVPALDRLEEPYRSCVLGWMPRDGRADPWYGWNLARSRADGVESARPSTVPVVLALRGACDDGDGG